MMNEQIHNAVIFERLVASIFEKNEFNIISADQMPFANQKYNFRDLGFDYLMMGPDTTPTTYAIEIKYYRSKEPQPRLIRDAACRLASHRNRLQVDKALLVLACDIPIPLRDDLEQEVGITIVDRTDLFGMAVKDAALLADLQSLLEQGVLTEKRDWDDIKRAITSKPRQIITPEPKNRFSEKHSLSLGASLRNIHKGKKNWPAYEKACLEILKYLFDEYLTGWQDQKRTDDGLNRFDLICRVRGGVNSFWSFISSELQSRYVLFEFKNYSTTITQHQVYTTERYLLYHGKRTVGFILSRTGPDQNAIMASKGAMREHGKLMVFLTDDDLHNMLDLRTKGNDPSDYLFDKVDDFLMSLSR